MQSIKEKIIKKERLNFKLKFKIVEILSLELNKRID